MEGKVAYKRSIVRPDRNAKAGPVAHLSVLPCLSLQHTHLLSAEECIMAAEFQNQHPNPCRHSSSGYFGSKFTTVCVSGNEQNQVDTKGYQAGVGVQHVPRALTVWVTAPTGV